jgi:predicted MPP superfamily phosphohydrolase
LILAGHTHGGQIVLPWLGAAHTHSEHLHRREAAGYLWRDQTQVYISRGIGEGIPIRFGARPQIALITVLAK